MLRLRLALSFTIIAGLSLLACPQAAKPLPPPPAASITRLTVSPERVARPGESVTVAWQTENASRVLLQRAGGALIPTSDTTGSASVVVDADSLFLLTAQGEGGTDARAVAVRVGEQVTGGALFSVVPSRVQAGQSVTLVWSIPNGSNVQIQEVGGAMVGGATPAATGSLTVTPNRTTRYRLSAAGAVDETVEVVVTPVVSGFSLLGSAPLAGQMGRLNWVTRGATQVTVRQVGVSTPLVTSIDAMQVATGEVGFMALAGLVPENELRFELVAESGAERAVAPLTVRVGGAVTIDRLGVPAFAALNSSFSVSWRTTGADFVDLYIVEGASRRLVYSAGSLADVAIGTTQLNSPPLGQPLTVELEARNTRAAVARATGSTEAVGPVSFVSFGADRTALDGGAEAVQLSWNVTNARRIRLSDPDGGSTFFASRTGTSVVQGQVTVYPNAAINTYRFEADNQAGSTITARELTVTVAAPATLTVNRQLPTGAVVTATGSTAPGATGLTGLATAPERNPAGEAFVDISRTGTDAMLFEFSTQTTATIPPFVTTHYGQRRTLTLLGLSRHGFFNAVSFGANPGSVGTSFGTTLDPFTIAPYWRINQTSTAGTLFWQIDDVADDQRLIVQWHEMAPADAPNARVTFQAQLYRSGKVVFAQGPTTGSLPVGPVLAGVVNGSESDEVRTPTVPVSGEVWRFFGATMSAPIRVESSPYIARAVLPNGYADVVGDPRVTPGLFDISEVHPNPAPGIVNGQWLEITSSAPRVIDLTGWDLVLQPMQTYRFPAGTLIPVGGRLLIAQSNNLGDPTNTVMADIVLPSGLGLVADGGAGTVQLAFEGGTYSSLPFPTEAPRGHSFAKELQTVAGAAYVTGLGGLGTCPSTQGLFGTQRGTPKAANGSCLPLSQTVGSSAFEPLASTGGALLIAGNASSCVSNARFRCVSGSSSDEMLIALDAGTNHLGVPSRELFISTNGWLSPRPQTGSVSGNKSTLSTFSPTFVIAPNWDDMQGLTPTQGFADAGASGVFHAYRDNATPADTSDDYHIVSWENWVPFGSTFTTTNRTTLNFQAKIYLDGRVQYHYGRYAIELSDGGPALQTSIDRVLGNSTTVMLDSWTGQQGYLPVVNAADGGIASNRSYLFSR